MNENLPVSTLLGFHPKREFGKKRIKQEQMTSIIQNVIKYIKKTKRFIFKPIFKKHNDVV